MCLLLKNNPNTIIPRPFEEEGMDKQAEQRPPGLLLGLTDVGLLIVVGGILFLGGLAHRLLYGMAGEEEEAEMWD